MHLIRLFTRSMVWTILAALPKKDGSDWKSPGKTREALSDRKCCNTDLVCGALSGESDLGCLSRDVERNFHRKSDGNDVCRTGNPFTIFCGFVSVCCSSDAADRKTVDRHSGDRSITFDRSGDILGTEGPSAGILENICGRLGVKN